VGKGVGRMDGVIVRYALGRGIE